MKAWFSKDSTKLKIGVATLVAFTGFAIVGSGYTVRPATELSSSDSVAQAPAQQVTLNEKSKISITQTKVVTTEEEVPFPTTQTFDGTLAKDTTAVRVDGSNGKKVIKTEVKIKDGLEVSRSLISEEVTVAPVAKVVAVGTKVVSSRQSSQKKEECDTHGFDRGIEDNECENVPDQIDNSQGN